MDIHKVEESLKTFRPRFFKDFPGQEEVKKRLEMFVLACKKRKESLDHCLLSGPPGLGKTTLAQIIAVSLGVPFRATTGPAIRRKGDLAAILTTLKEGSVLFIDEIHRLTKDVEEYLYSAMEDFYIDVITGEGMGARSVRLSLPPFTLVGATTKVGLLKAPFRDRFGIVERLSYYDEKSLKMIIKKYASFLKIKIDEGGAAEIARRCRGTPRVAGRLLKRVRDFMQVKNLPMLSSMAAREGLAYIGVDEKGLTDVDENILKLMRDEFSGGPVGLEALASLLSEDPSTVEDVYEPFLVKQGLVQRSPKGRLLTFDGRAHLEKTKQGKTILQPHPPNPPSPL